MTAEETLTIKTLQVAPKDDRSQHELLKAFAESNGVAIGGSDTVAKVWLLRQKAKQLFMPDGAPIQSFTPVKASGDSWQLRCTLLSHDADAQFALYSVDFA